MSSLDEDSKRRLQGNPLRILDSKNPPMQALIAAAPVMLDALDGESREHFDALCALLRGAGIEYHVAPRLVRGLDYYSRTVFEWVTDALGAQSTVCAGGRYDGLVAQLGGAPTPGIGWAMGQERVVMLLEKLGLSAAAQRPQLYMVVAGAGADLAALKLAEALRDAWPRLRLQYNLSGGNFKTQFKRADKSGADFALVLGEDDIALASERIGGLLGLKAGDAE
jgi:histidyl-tRNA synthetase